MPSANARHRGADAVSQVATQLRPWLTDSERKHYDCHRTCRKAIGNPSLHDGDLLTIEQAADLLNITDHFVRRLIRERRIPFLKVGRLVRFRRADIEAYLVQCAVPAVRR